MPISLYMASVLTTGGKELLLLPSKGVNLPLVLSPRISFPRLPPVTADGLTISVGTLLFWFTPAHGEDRHTLGWLPRVVCILCRSMCLACSQPSSLVL